MEWRKITSANAETVKMLAKQGHPIIVARKNVGAPIRYKGLSDWQAPLEFMTKHGGYYYCVLPKLY